MQESALTNLDFWYDFASPYSYLSAMRIQSLADEKSVKINWRPFVLSPILKKHKRKLSIFEESPPKSTYALRDIERLCETHDIPFNLPSTLSTLPLLATREAYAGRQSPWIGSFTKAVYIAEFGQDLDISDENLIRRLLVEVGVEADKVLSKAQSLEVKIGLRAAVADAQTQGIFGAPSFVTPNGDIYWGNDRLEQALNAASKN